MALLRRKRLQDGSLGELEKVFDGETEEERIQRLEEENKSLENQMLEMQEYMIRKELEDLLQQGGM